MDQVLDQYFRTVRPMHLSFVWPSRRHADVVIPNEGLNDVAVGMVAEERMPESERAKVAKKIANR